MGALLMTDQHLTELEKKKLLTDLEKIELLKGRAKELVAARVERPEALALLRGFNSDINGPCHDPELQSFLRGASRGRTTLSDLVKPGDKLSLKAQPFLLDGVFSPNDTNLVIGREKKGKTSFVIAWISAWHYHQLKFCGFDIVGDCPPVIVIGPDMTEQQWGQFLRMYHLADDEGIVHRDGPIKKLLHMGLPFALDQNGLDLIDQLGEFYPNALFLFDSYSRLVEPLGLREETAEFAGPLIQAQAILQRHKATGIWLHHSAANRDTGKASSRGSTALPAAADQIVFLEYPSANEDDPKTLLRTKGRSIPVKAILEKTQPDGVWICHASGDELEEQRKIQSRINKVRTGTLAEKLFCAMQALHTANPCGVDLCQLAEAVDFDQTPKELDKLRKPLQRLRDLQLISLSSDRNLSGIGNEGGRPRDIYCLLPSVQKLLGMNTDQSHTRRCVQKPLKTPETPCCNASGGTSRVQESHLSISKSPETSQGLDSNDFSAGEVSDLFGINSPFSRSGPPEADPPLKGPTMKVNITSLLGRHEQTFWQIVEETPDALPNPIANKFMVATGRILEGRKVLELIKNRPLN